MNGSVLIIGGAGYIGSHTVRAMAEQGYRVVVLDNLIYGHREALVSPGVTFYQGDMADAALVERIFSGHEITSVMHFAAYAYVGESVTAPAKYYLNNTAAPLVILEAMRRHGCRAFVFSSTCATYGNPQYVPMDENHPQEPINPYGRSKLMLEKILKDYDHAYGIRFASLRYFNACGCSEDSVIGEDHDPETHLIPLVLMAIAGQRENVTVFGTDYPTPDGTCIRDYIHILDLARAHIRAVDLLASGSASFFCNLGTGRGVSVNEIIRIAQEVSGKKCPVVYGERRAGDPPELVAAPVKAKEVLGWEAEYKDVRESIRTSWNWICQPHGGRYRNFPKADHP